MAAVTGEPWIQLNTEVIESFLAEQERRGLSASSVQAYRRNLLKLYGELPKDKRITAGTAANWRTRMLDRGIAPRSVNARLSALNSLCGYLGHREFQNCDFVDGPEITQPELTRGEYLRLLSAAKYLEKERSYFIIKVLGGVGLRVQELSQVTVEAIQTGVVRLSRHNQRRQRTVSIPQPLRGELLRFVRRKGISDGPIFRTAEGRPISRTYACKMLQQVGRTACVDEEKATPRCLWNMYQSTREEILDSISLLADQAYDRMLAEEQETTSWDQ